MKYIYVLLGGQNYVFAHVLSSLIIFSDLSCMNESFDEPTEDFAVVEFDEKQVSNFLPTELRKALINNTFFETAEIGFGEALDNIQWKDWTEEELKIICNILSSGIAKGHTQLILNYLHTLQSLCYCIEKFPENASNNLKFEVLKLVEKTFNCISKVQ